MGAAAARRARMALASRARPGAGCACAALLAACLLAALQALPHAAGQTTLTLQTAQPNGNTNTSLVLATALLTNAGTGVANQPIVFGTVGTTGAHSAAASCGSHNRRACTEPPDRHTMLATAMLVLTDMTIIRQCPDRGVVAWQPLQ